MSVNEDEIVVAGYGKLPHGTSVEQLHKVLALVVLVDRRDGKVLDATSTLIARVADEFVCRNMVGMSLLAEASDFIAFLQTHYHGLAQRAVIAAFRDLVRRFAEVTQHDHLLEEEQA